MYEQSSSLTFNVLAWFQEGYYTAGWTAGYAACQGAATWAERSNWPRTAPFWEDSRETTEDKTGKRSSSDIQACSDRSLLFLLLSFLFLQTRLSQQLVNVEHHQKLQQPFTSPGARSPTNTAKSPVNTVSPHQQPRPPAVKTISPISNSKPQQVWSMCTYPCIVVES